MAQYVNLAIKQKKQQKLLLNSVHAPNIPAGLMEMNRTLVQLALSLPPLLDPGNLYAKCDVTEQSCANIHVLCPFIYEA